MARLGERLAHPGRVQVAPRGDVIGHAHHFLALAVGLARELVP